MTESALVTALWPEHQHLNFGEIHQVARAAFKAISDTSFELTKAKIAEVGVKVIDSETFYGRDLTFIGEGNLDFHVTTWGDTGKNVQIGVRAGSALEAQRTALAWTRKSFYRDQRNIGIVNVERPSEQVAA